MAKLKKSSKKSSDKTKKKPMSAGKIIIGPCRGSYMFCNELVHDKEDENKVKSKRCTATAIVRKKDKDTVKKIKKVIRAVAEAKFGKDVNMKSKNFTNPLRNADKEMKNGDIEHSKDLENCFFIKTKSYKIPGLVDQYNTPIEDPDDRENLVVSGYYYMFSIVFKAFDHKSGNKGVRAELNNLMFKKEGPRLDGGMAAEDEFGDYAEDDDDYDDDD